MELDKVIRPDAKGRISLGSLVKGISGYRAIFNEVTKEITLKPYTEIPLQEEWLFKNKEALERVKQGLKESSEGDVSFRGSFSSFVEE